MIPINLRKKLSDDPFMKRCCLEDGECSGKIEWHHVFIYKNRQINEKWSILPACKGKHHTREFLILIEYIALKRVSLEDMEEAETKYPKFNWKQRKIYLESQINDKIIKQIDN